MTPVMQPSDWHTRFCQQAQWTQALRRYLFHRAGWKGAGRALEVGCGTGAVLGEYSEPATKAYGLDNSRAHLDLAAKNAPQARCVEGDAHRLPYARAAFDLTYCHFLLLWVNDPLQVVKEMRRVTHPRGAVLALAEPDYGARIDHPPELAQLGRWQQEALRRQGADATIGRKLAGIFNAAGLEAVETGVLGGQWTGQPSQEAWELEWQVLLSDLRLLPDPIEAEAVRLQTIDRQAWLRGERVLFVPTFYAWGRAPDA